MEEVSIIGIDLAKRSFQVHAARADGSVAYRKPPSPRVRSLRVSSMTRRWRSNRSVHL